MGWTSLKISPGFVRDITRYAVSGTWYDGNLVRFRQGAPEKWGGWVLDYDGFAFEGMCRSLHRHGILDGTIWTSAGTNTNFYMLTSDEHNDVTPISLSVTLGANPFASTIGTTTVVVTHALHGHSVGDTVIFGDAVGFAGIPAGELNGTHEITGFVDDNKYQIQVTTPASSTTTGGGAIVKAND